MTAHKSLITVALIICASLLLILLLHLYATFFLSKYYGISIADIVLIITAGAVFWYAWETRKLRKVNEKQLSILSTPRLEVSSGIVYKHDLVLHRFLINNEGDGIAMNIELIALEYSGEGKPIFRKMNILRKGITGELVIEKIKMKNGEDISGEIGVSKFLNDNLLYGDPIPFELKFSDILGNSYSDKLILSQGKFTI